VVRTAAQEWGYPYLKLDFLYAAALKGRYRDRTKTRAQVLRRGLETLRDAVGEEVTLLGCGVPLGPALGLVEIMRIGADVAPRWPPEWNQRDFFFPREPNMPSTRNALQNILTRAPFHRRWWINDPDCLLVRPDTELSLAETRSLATAIALSGGSLLISDDLPNVPRERLRLVRQLLPLIGKRPWVLDWFDEPKPRLMRLDLENASGSWHLLAVFNWADQPETEQPLELSRFQLPPGRYLAREFWTGAVHKFAGVNLPVPEIPPHGVRLLSLRSLNVPDLPLYSGGNLHLSQGLEVQTWSAGQDGVDFVLKRPGQAQGHMDLYLPVPPFEISVNQKSSNWSTINPDIYRVPVNFQARAQIQIILRSPS
jgi:alpha-galactosidase